MNYLIDTHVMVLALLDPEKLTSKVRSIIEDPNNSILVCVTSFWEISLKYSLGKLNLQTFTPTDFPQLCKDIGFEILPLPVECSASYHFLKPLYHRDPFDRLLIHIAVQLAIPLISKDSSIKLYESEGLKVIW